LTITSLIFLGVGLIGLFVGSRLLVDSGKSLAKRLGVSEMLIGLTVVSIGTSLPEIMVSIFSATRGASDIAIGTTIGSCLTQITLILGVAAIIHKIHANKKAMNIDGPMLLLSISIFFIFMYTGQVLTRVEGLVLMLLYVTYVIYTSRKSEHRKVKHEEGKHHSKGYPLILRCCLLAVGVGIVLFSADLVMDHAVILAGAAHLSEAFIGVMIIGVSTCLPELSTAITASVKKAPGLAIGTLIGSNITDPLLSVGAGAAINGFSVNENLLYFDMPFWFASSLVAILLIKLGHNTISDKVGFTLVGIYLVFAYLKLGFI